jgi:cyclohexanecarboxylate-CoA ligase
MVDPILSQARIEQMRREGWWRDENLLDYFDAAVKNCPEHIAVVDYRLESDEKNALTYRELNARVTRIALALAHYGVEKQDIVSFQLPGWWEFVAIHLACMRIGAVSNPLMTIFRERELSYMVDFAEARVMIIPKVVRNFDHEAMLAGLRDKLPRLQHLFVVGGDGENSFESALLNHSLADSVDATALFTERKLGPNDVMQLMYTSGTTGMPKGVMHGSNTLLYNILSFIERTRLTGDDVIFMGSPLAHQTGFTYGMWLPIVLQARMVLLDQWQGEIAWKLIAEENVTFAMGATPFLADLTNSEAADQHNSECFRMFVCGGAPVPRVLAERAAKKLQIDLMTVWGMSECGAITTTRLDDPVEKIFGTDGLAYPGTELKILDQEGCVAPAGEEGRLYQRSPATFIGYLKRPDTYALDEDGFFDTGDLARLDQDGYVRITGRSKDIIIRGGENIPVVEVENMLYEHPATVDVAVVAMPDERLGELGCCFVTLQPGHTLTFAQMQAFLSDRQVTKTYWPERLEIIDVMPRTASGKIQKFQLREQAKNLRKFS